MTQIDSAQVKTKPARREKGPALHFGGLETVSLVKYFKRKGSKLFVKAIDGVSLKVEPGEMVVLLGPSGCGKTTILRCVAGLDTPDEGDIVVNGRTVFSGGDKVNVPVNKRNTSVIFQGYALWPHMTVGDNIRYPLQAAGGSTRGSMDEKVQAMLELVGVPDLGKEYPGTLSGGQQQRVSLARALVSDPPIVLFDEPLSNVDAQVRHTLRRQIKAMHRRVGFTAIYVTHDQEEALSLADRIVVLSQGKVVQSGTPDEVYNYPNSKYVAEFVGRANVFPVAVSSGEPGRAIADFGQLAVSEVVNPDSEKGQFAVVRPEDIALAAPSEVSSDTATIVEAIVRSSEFLGARYEFIAEAAGVVLRVECAKSIDPPLVNDLVRLRIPQKAARVVPQ
jgi:iron(III) transport system ATP-binding protein